MGHSLNYTYNNVMFCVQNVTKFVLSLMVKKVVYNSVIIINKSYQRKKYSSFDVLFRIVKI